MTRFAGDAVQIEVRFPLQKRLAGAQVPDKLFWRIRDENSGTNEVSELGSDAFIRYEQSELRMKDM